MKQSDRTGARHIERVDILLLRAFTAHDANQRIAFIAHRIAESARLISNDDHHTLGVAHSQLRQFDVLSAILILILRSHIESDDSPSAAL